MAFEASERARARSLIESLAEAGVDLRSGVDPALLAIEAGLQAELEAWGRRQTESGGRDAAALAAARRRYVGPAERTIADGDCT